MVLLLVAAAWALLHALDADRPTRWLVLAGAFVGLAFNTKMLAAAIPLPGFGLAVLAGTAGGWWPKVRAAFVFGTSALAFSLPWMLAVDLTPASNRPYVGGSTDDTVWRSASSASRLNTMLSELEDAFAEREATEARLRRFLADVSHELRTLSRRSRASRNCSASAPSRTTSTSR